MGPLESLTTDLIKSVRDVQHPECVLQDLKRISKGLICLSFPYSATSVSQSDSMLLNLAAQELSSPGIASSSDWPEGLDDEQQDDSAHRCWGLGQLIAMGLVNTLSHIISSKKVAKATAFNLLGG